MQILAIMTELDLRGASSQVFDFRLCILVLLYNKAEIKVVMAQESASGTYEELKVKY